MVIEEYPYPVLFLMTEPVRGIFYGTSETAISENRKNHKTGRIRRIKERIDHRPIELSSFRFDLRPTGSFVLMEAENTNSL